MTWRALMGMLLVATSAATVFGAGTPPVGAVELPPDNDNSLFIQTSGPNSGIGIGDWYTAPGGGDQDHLLDITVPATWPAGLTVTVALYDPEVNGDDPTGLLADDEPRGSGPDDTTYWITDPNGDEIVNTTYTPTGGTNGEWAELITFTPVAGGGVYALENSTSDDDDNSWRLSVAHDPDCADGTCSATELNNGNEYDDPDGTPGTADEIEVELISTTFQHAGTGLVCNDFYFYVDGSKPTISLHNFDMDNAGSVIYTLPDGSTENGTVSGSTTWNSSRNTDRVGDTLPVDSTSIGWWSAQICLTPNNQYIFEGEIDEPVFLEEPPPLPDIELTKTDNVDTTVPGATLNYLVGYDNVSDDTASPAPAFNVVITDTLPANTTYVGCSFVSGLTGTCSESGGVVTWTMSGQVPSGDSGAVGLEVIVGAGAEGTFTNVADVTWLDAYGRNYAADAASDNDVVVDSGLFITKTSDVTGAGVNAGDVITYTVDITNVGDVVNTSVVIYDPIPTGTTYNAETTSVDYFEVTDSQSWTDDFSSADYDGGSANWSTPWLELGENNGPNGGDVNVPNESGDRRLHIQDNNRGAERELDLSGFAAATLSFDMKIVDFDDTDDYVDVEVSNDGGDSWTVLESFVGPLDETSYTTYTYDLTPYLAGNSRIRFATNELSMSNGDDIYIDDVSVLAATTAPVTKTNQLSDPTPLDNGTPPDLVTVSDAAALAPGQRMTLTYQVTVDDQPGVARIVNTATTSSIESPDQIGAAVIDPVLVAEISGVAFEDADGNGVNDIVDGGIASVAVELLDGLGVVIDTTATNPTGGYRFENLVAGDYAVRFATPVGALITLQDQGSDDTADSDIAPSDGTTPTFSVTGGVDLTDIDGGFVFGATIGDEVWVDSDGDGTQGGAEPGLAGVTVELLDGAGAVVDTTVSADGTGADPLGFYTFTDIAPGVYSVRFVAPGGYVFTIPDQVVDSDDSDPDRTTGETPQTTLVSGQTLTTIDAGLFQPIVIGDVIWLDLDSDGIQDSLNLSGGEPGARGVTVNLLDSTGGQIDSTTTAADGSYSFNVPQPGSFQIEVEGAGFAFSGQDQGSDDTVDSDVDPSGLTALFPVASGVDDLSVDAGIIPTTLGDTVWLDADADGIQAGPQTGVNAVTVNLRTAAGALIDSQTTGLDGTYSFDIGPGDVLVEFVAPSGYALSPQDQGADDDLDADPDPSTGRTAVISVTSPTPIDNVDAGLFQAATISDRVWLDRDGNGVQAADTSATGEPGLAGVTVNLLDPSGTTVIATTTTADGSGADPIGYYEYNELAPGSYIVEFEAPAGHDFTSQDAGSNDALDSDVDTTTGRTATITVLSGATVTAVDAGLFEPATIGDRAWVDADGDGIQDGTEVGLAGVTVDLLDATGTTVIATTTTTDGTGSDPIGSYEFSGLAPGQYRISMTAPGSEVFSPQGAGADAAVDSDLSTTTGQSGLVTVASGEADTTVDGGFHVPGTIGDRVWADTDGDGVQDRGETGLDGITVRLLDSTGTTVAATTTADGTGPDPLGFYVFADIGPGSYRIEVVLPVGSVFSPAGAGSDGSLDSDVSVSTGRSSLMAVTSGFTSSDIDAGIHVLADLGDRVWEDLDADGAQDSGEPGLADVTVNLLDATGTTTLATTTTSDGTGADPIGHYQFIGVAPGTYVVEVERPGGYAPSPIDAVADDVDSDIGAAGRTAQIVVVSGGSTADVDGGLFRTASVGDRVWLDSDGDGIQDGTEVGLAGVTVNLLDATGTTVVSTTTTADGTGTDPIGYYGFTGVTPGDYVIEVVAPAGHVFTTEGSGTATDSDVDSTTGRTEVLSIASASSTGAIDAGLFELSTIGDRVWEDADGDGIQDGTELGLAGVAVNLLDATGTAVVLTTTTADGTGADPIGHYEFTGLAPGTYIVEVVEPSGFVVAPRDQGSDGTVDSDLSATSGRTATLVVTSGLNTSDVDAGLLRLGSVGDLVWNDLDGDGIQDGTEVGLAAVTVNLLDATGTTVVATTTTADGTGADPVGFYEFTGIAPGSYRVEVVEPSGYIVSPRDQGPDDALDSDISGTNGRSAVFTVTSGFTSTDIDAGLYQPSSIGDRVWEDANANGVQDSAEVGLAGVTVNLLDATGTAVVATTTTADGTGADPIGYYEFSNLPTGSFIVEVIEPISYSVSAQDQGSEDSEDSDIDPSSGRTSAIATTAGFTTGNTDAGLFRTGSVGDLVWDDVDADGTRDRSEVGLAGVTVNLLDATGTAVVATTTTADGTGADPIGHYEFTGITPGSYIVEVVSPAGRAFGPQNQGSDDTADSDVSTSTGRTATIVITSGSSTADVDAGLFLTNTIGDIVWEDLDGDGTQDGLNQPSGEPGIGGVTVRLLDNTGTTVLASTTTADGNGADPLGFYQFSGLAPASYRIEVIAPAGHRITVRNAGSDATDSDLDPTTGISSSMGVTAGAFVSEVDGGLFRPGSVGDRVWEDTDADGIQDRSETGLAGVTVNLLDSAGTAVVAATTTADGTGTDPVGFYAFTGVAPGDYLVEVVEPAGYTVSAPDQGSDDAVDSDIALVTGRSGTITVSSGSSTSEVDAGLYRLASIGDRVWNDADGDGIQDGSEIGLPGVTVRLLEATGTTVVASTTTADGTGADAVGFYEFAGLTPASYRIEVVAPVGFALSPQNQGVDDSADSDASPTTGRTATIRLSSGDSEVTIDAGLYLLAVIGDRVFEDDNANGIQDGPDTGLAGITVNLLDATGTAVIATTTTADGTGADPIGSYEFTDVAQGAYRIEVIEPTGFTLSANDQGSDDTLDSDPNPTTGRTPTFTINAGDTFDNIDAGLYADASLGDRVFEDDNANGVQDGAETGLAGVTVRLLDATGATVVAATTTADGTGADPIGYYQFTGVVPGSYIVEVVEPIGYTTSPPNQGVDDTVDSDISPTTGRTAVLTLSSGSTSADTDAGLYRSGSIGDRVWDDADGDGIQDGAETGLAGVTVNLLDAAGTTVVATTTTADGAGADPIGYYQFTGIAPGDYIVEVALPATRVASPIDRGASDALDSDIGADGRTAPITVSPGDTLGTVDGGSFVPAVIGDRVWLDRNGDGEQDSDTSATGEPGLTGVRVNLLDSSGAVVATTTTADGTGILGLGEYRFSDVVPGVYEIEIVPPADHGISPADQGGDDNSDSDIDPTDGRTAAFAVGSGDRVDIDGGLWEYSTLGDLVFSDLAGDGSQAGDPGLGSVTVRLLDATGTTVIATMDSGADGSYLFTGLAPGAYIVDVLETTAPGGFVLSTANDDAPVTLTSGDDVDSIDFGFEPIAALAIRKSPDAQDVVETGTATFTITVVNNGSAVTGVAVSDPLAPDCDRVIGAMANGATTSYSCTLDNVSSDFINTATVNGTGIGGAVSASDTADVTVLVPAIEISKSPNAQSITIGGTTNFSITVRNTGTADLVNVVVSDPLAPDCDRTVASLAVGASSTATCTLDDVTADFTNTATVIASTAIATTVTDDDTADVTVLRPALSVDKSPAGQTILTGGTADFAITVTNTGQTTLNNVVVTDPATPNCDGSFATIPVSQTRTINCSLVGVTADFTNQVNVVASDPIGGTLDESAAANVDVIDPSVSIDKTPDTQGIASGGTAEFTIGVTNTGDVVLTNVVVSDPLAPDCDRTISTLPVGATDSATCSLAGVTADFTNVADVVADTPLGGTVTNTDGALVDVLDPSISITKTPDNQTVVEGDSANFTITVANTGDVELSDVTVTDPATPGCDSVVGTLAIGAVETITCSLVGVTADFTNTATVDATAAGIGTLSESDTANVVVLSAGLDIQKSPNIQLVPTGGTATFEIRVTNAGAVDLNSVVVTDPLAPGCDNTLGDLLAGQTVTYSCALAGVTDDFVNTATVDAFDPVGAPLRDLDTAAVDAVTSGVELTKSPDTQSVTSGGTADFTVEVANTGDLELTNVVVSDPSAPDCSTTLASLAAGTSVVLTCSVSGVSADFTNTADVVADVAGGGTVTDTGTGTVTVLTPAVTIEKSPDTQSVLTGGTATFTITVRNAGETTLDSVAVSDPLAPTCDRAIGTLLAAESVSYTCTLGGVGGDFTNSATVDAIDPLGGPVTDSDTADIAVLVPAVSVAKGPNLQTVVTGGTATFDIDVTNTGGVDLFNVSVTDPLAPDCDTVVGTLAVGQTRTISCTEIGVTSSFTNTANVVAEDALGNTASADDSAEVVVVIPGIEISKLPDTQQVVLGDDANFSIEVTNTGTEVIATATVSDPLAPDCDTTITNLAVGASITVNCTVTAAAADFVNVATVTGADTLGNPVSDADDAAVDVIDPSIAINKGPDPQVAVIGGNAAFEVSVTNSGDTPLTDVDVADPNAPDCNRTYALLAPGEVRTFSCILSNVSAAFTNTIDVAATDPLANTVTDRDTAEVLVVVPAIEIAKSPAAQLIETGTDATFDITVRNTGATQLTGVRVADAQTPDCNRSIGALAPGEVSAYTCTATNVAADFTNTVVVSSDDPLGRNVGDTDSAEVSVLGAAIDIQKTPDVQTVVRNGTATFVIEVSNLGQLPLTAVTVNDPAAPDCDSVIPTLDPGTSISITCTSTNVTADFTNTADVTATTPTGGTVTGSDSADITVLVPSITVSKTPDLQTVPTNGTATFTIVATNNGQTTLTGVTVTDPLAPNCDTAVPVTLEPGEDLTVTCSVTVGSNDFTNVATVDAVDPIGGAVSDNDDAEVDVFAAGSVDGVVFIDRDGDTTYEPGAPDNEPGVGGVAVTLLDAGDLVVATSQTQLDGSYTFADIPVGDYTVQVDGSDPDLPAGHLLSTSNETQFVTVAEGAATTANPVGYTPQATLGGVAFIDADGDGIDEGTPLAGVTVTVFDSLGDTVASETTGADGSWSISGLYPDDYTVGFDPPVGHRITARDVGSDDTLDSDPDPDTGTTPPVTVAAGSTTGDIDSGFFQPITIGDTVFADHNGDGSQQTANEPGLPGVEVTITWAGPDGVLGTGDDDVTTVVTDGVGSYLRSGLAPGAYEVAVAEPAGTTVTTGNDPIQITFSSGDTDITIDFGVQGNSSLAGTVIRDQNGNGVRDASEPGIGGVEVTITWAGPDGVFGTPGDSTFALRTAVDGTWSVIGLPAGDYRVDVDESSAPNGLDTVSFDHDATPDGTTDVSLQAGIGMSGIDTGLATGATIGGTIFADDNRNGIQDSTEPGLGGVTVVITWHGPDGVLDGGDDVVSTAVTAADGTWLADDVAAGTYTVTVDPTTIPVGYWDGGQATVTVVLDQIDLSADIGLIPNQPATINQTYDVTVTVGQAPPSVLLTDPNGDPAAITLSSGSVPGLTLNDDGSWSGTASTPGVHEIDVTVCDSFDACTNHTLTVRVLAQPSTGLAFTGGSFAVMLGLGLLLLGSGSALRLWRKRNLTA